MDLPLEIYEITMTMGTKRQGDTNKTELDKCHSVVRRLPGEGSESCNEFLEIFHEHFDDNVGSVASSRFHPGSRDIMPPPAK
jgi:hypothetical protein